MAEYGYSFEVGVAGQIVNMAVCRIESFVAEETIAFGSTLVRGDSDTGCAVSTDASGEEFIGVALFDRSRVPSEIGGTAQYEEGDMVRVLRKGPVYMTAGSAGTAGATAYAGGTTVTATATTNLGAIGAFKAAVSSGDLVAVEINGLGV